MDGSKVAMVYTANDDGKDVPLTGLATVDTTSLKRINATTTKRTDKKSDKVVATRTRVVSAGGKSMTTTQKGTTAQRQAIDHVLVYAKQ